MHRNKISIPLRESVYTVNSNYTKSVKDINPVPIDPEYNLMFFKETCFTVVCGKVYQFAWSYRI
jgi:hypothetical protein